jgi:hypothetical protein
MGMQFTVATVRKVRTTATRVIADSPQAAADDILGTRLEQGGKNPVTEVRVYAGHIDRKLTHLHVPILVVEC